VPFACNAIGLLILLKLCPPSSFLQWYCELFTDALVLQGIPSTSDVVVALAPDTHVIADSRIGLLCHALHICVADAPPESCPSVLLVH